MLRLYLCRAAKIFPGQQCAKTGNGESPLSVLKKVVRSLM